MVKALYQLFLPEWRRGGPRGTREERKNGLERGQGRRKCKILGNGGNSGHLNDEFAGRCSRWEGGEGGAHRLQAGRSV
jgi:hypothetical protein